MANFVKVSFVLALFVVCASVFIEVQGARDNNNNGNAPAVAPYVDPVAETCRITGACSESLAQLIVTKSMPGEKDVVCCQELVQTTKACWEKIMDILEDSNVPPFVNLHPWAENAWNKCVSLTDSEAQAPMVSYNSPAQTPTVPKQCRLSGMCVDILAHLVVSKTLPTIKDFTCCKEIKQKTKYCWDKTMEILEDPNVPALAHLHPWADNAWDRCISIANEKILPH